jgi:nucleoside permease NupC
LCGYANPGSIGAQIGTLSAMAPDRQSDFAKVAFRAFIAGSMANFMNACVAGWLFHFRIIVHHSPHSLSQSNFWTPQVL